MILSKELEKLGFNDKEAKVYLAGLELGMANIEQIAKKSGVKRTTLYDVVEGLKAKGYLTRVKKDKKYLWMAENPERIEKDLEYKKEIFDKISPNLKSITNLLFNKPEVKYYEGLENIKKVYLETLKYPDSQIWSFNTKNVYKVFNEQEFEKKYVDARVKKKIFIRFISEDYPFIREEQKQDEEKFRQIKILPKGLANFEMDIFMFGRQETAFISFKDEIALFVRSEDIYKMMRNIFNICWNFI